MSNIIPAPTTDEKVIVPAALTDNGITNEGVATQVANPKRASWRTFVQTVVGYLVIANAIVLVVTPFVLDPANGLEAALGPIYGYLVLVLNAIGFVVATASKLLSLLMANPVVNEWIAAHLSWLAPAKPVGK